MTYRDAQGRPEIVMHPDIVRGGASYRTVVEPAGADQPAQPPTASSGRQDTARRPSAER